MPDKKLRKMTLLVQEQWFNRKTTITVTIDGLAPFVYSYTPLNSEGNLYQLQHKGHCIWVTALSSDNLFDPQFSQQQFYWLVDSPPFVAPDGTLMLPAFYMDSDSAYPPPAEPQTEANDGTTAAARPAPKHLAGTHFSIGLEDNAPPGMHFNFIVEPSGHLLQSSSDHYHITSAGPQEIISHEWPEFGSFGNKPGSDDESSLSEDPDSETDDLDVALKGCHLSPHYRKDRDDDPSPPSDHQINTLLQIQTNHSGYLPLKPRRLKYGSDEVYSSGYYFDDLDSFHRAGSAAPIILILESLVKTF